MMILILILVEAAIIFFLILLFVFLGLPLLFTGAPFIPSYRRARRQALKSLFDIAQKASGKKFIDLGSGDGRVVIEFAQQGFESTGIELNPFLVFWSRIKIQKSLLRQGLRLREVSDSRSFAGRAKIIRDNFWNVDLSDFDIIFIFQLNYVNALLAEKFKKELKTGAIIISAGFPMFGFDLFKKEGIFWIYRN